MTQAPRLYVDPPLAAGGQVTLPETAARHVVRVLRLRAGDALTVFDGRGGEYRATLARVSRAAVVVDVGAHEPADRESPLIVELGQGICKGDRMDLVVQKATELGVGIIRPIVCERTVVKLDLKLDPGRAERRLAHWRAIAVHAAQQSGRTRVPEVAGIEHLDPWLDPWLAYSDTGPGPMFVLSPHADQSLPDCAPPAPGKPVRLLVGPEGGLSPREVERARAAGFTGLRLGPRVLRTETAALVALAALQAHWGDLR
ncbi:MAG: 16S rRNA (uracil(1498)-N(3))-methyltransferase [Thiotrichales bacterium]|nr:16S rRNA (uracil(1498)-N(3))-methyltransferase [Thiotrichales bacterium]